MTNKEKEILAWEFEEMLRNLVSGYLKLEKFNSFETHLELNNERYDIHIFKRNSAS